MTLTRILGLTVAAFSALALISHSLESDGPSWRSSTAFVGIFFQGLAVLVGPERRKHYNALLGVSFVSIVASYMLGVLGWPW